MVDAILERAGYRNRILTAYKRAVQQGLKPQVLKTEYARILRERLSALFYSVDGAYTRGAAARAKPLEAENRHDWDAVFSHFYASVEDGATSKNVLYATT